MSAAPLLAVTDLRVTYPGHPPTEAVRGVSFELFPGEVLGLVGESGCGKSTIARAVAGLLAPSGGTVEFAGQPVTPLRAGRRPIGQTGIQMVFQDPASSLNPRRRIGRQIEDGLRAAVRRRPDGTGRVTAAAWLERVGLDPANARRFPTAFSGGQRQRVAIARALAAEPALLVADEPISSLDASTQARVAGLLCRLAQEQDTALLFISHDLSIVRLIADRLIVMNRGEIVEAGRTEAVWGSPQHPYTQKLLASIPKPDGKGILPEE
jgi:peptide/nickel transport system ATP-binding protein